SPRDLPTGKRRLELDCSAMTNPLSFRRMASWRAQPPAATLLRWRLLSRPICRPRRLASEDLPGAVSERGRAALLNAAWRNDRGGGAHIWLAVWRLAQHRQMSAATLQVTQLFPDGRRKVIERRTA